MEKSDKKKCLRCGGTNIVPSELQSTGKMYARPKHAKLSTILTTGVLVQGDVCFDCGHDCGRRENKVALKSVLRRPRPGCLARAAWPCLKNAERWGQPVCPGNQA